ncbi:MAG: hypothetical protein ACYC0H_06945 [Solirubrobacteraceae bacterium]
MWFYPVLLATLAFVLIGGSLAGGIFTIFLVPLGILLLLFAFGGATFRLYVRHAPDPGTGRRGNALPRRSPGDPGSVPTTPEDLADARRAAQ